MSYILYYKILLAHKDKLIIGRFEDVCNNINSIIYKLNLKYDTVFKPVATNEKVIFDILDKRALENKLTEYQISRPSKIKEIRKGEIRAELTERHSQLLRMAHKVFLKYVS